jgi:hypothetical protein
MKVYAISRPKLERSTEPCPCKLCGGRASVDVLVDSPERRYCQRRYYALPDCDLEVFSVCAQCGRRLGRMVDRLAARGPK